MFLCIFPTYFFPRNPKIIAIFSRKKIFKKLFSIEVIFFYSTLMKLNLQFFVCLHVNRVFRACIHDTNIIPECQEKHKLKVGLHLRCLVHGACTVPTVHVPRGHCGQHRTDTGNVCAALRKNKTILILMYGVARCARRRTRSGQAPCSAVQAADSAA